MHFDRWSGQWVGQATTSGADAASTVPADANAGAADITSTNYASALNSISSSPAMNPTTPTSSTTYLIAGIAAVGLIFFLTRK